MKNILKALAPTLAALAIAPTLTATLITFDDLPAHFIPNGYNGLNWGNFGAVDSGCCGPSGYQNGVVSNPNVAFNRYGDPADFSSNPPFTFNSVYLTGAWNDGLHIEVQGFNGANLIYDRTVRVNTSGPTLFNFNYLNVTEVNFISFGGVPHGYIGEGEHFVMDNLTINELVSSVPETSEYCMPIALGALLAFGAVQRRRRVASRHPVFADKSRPYTSHKATD